LLDLNSSCISDFNFLSVVQTQDLNGLKADGIIGLSPSTQNTQASLFVDELYNSGIIDQRIFSSYMSEGVTSSVATFGGYSMDYADPDSNLTITWNSLIDTNYWSVEMIGVKVGDNEVTISTNIAIVDTGTSYLLMPTGKIKL